jgi:hypothetical protein
MTTFEPGTVAELLIGSERVRAIVRDDEWLIVGHSYFKSIAVGNEALIDDVRPLVVLDLDGIAPEAIVKALRDKDAGTNGTGWARVADQIEAQTKPQRIPEPGLWGVVTFNMSFDVPGARSSSGWAVRRLTDGEADWQDGAGHYWAWNELVDPVLVRDGIEDSAS